MVPLRWKQETINLDFKRVVSDYQGRVRAARSDAEFYRVLARFVAELKDAHVTPMIPSTYRASLGFMSDFIEGKVLIETIDRLRMPELLFPFKKGDQVIAIGGVPVEELMAELGQIGHTGNEASTIRIAAARLTSRREASGFQVPRGVTTVTVLPKGAERPVTVTATWIVSGSPVVELDDLARLMEDGAVVNAIPTASDGEGLRKELNKLSMFNMALPSALVKELQQIGLSNVGAPKSMFRLPEGAREIPGIPVTAAIYEAAGKKIGILRIPSFGDEGLLEVVARALMTLERETDVLVLDQTNNPGGSVSLVSDIVSLFADRSFKDMDFEIRPSLAWLKSFQDINTQIENMLRTNPQDVAANALKARFEYLESEIRESLKERRFLTNPVSLNLVGSFGMIQPAGMVSYTKPVLMLINEFDFSGGDAFPALLKDNGRVTLFGTQTSGAGGNVREYGPLANSFFKLALTESLMIRPNGQYMENRGIQPDIEYAVTEDDFMNGYRNYVRAFTIEALKLVGVSEAEFAAAEAATSETGSN
jgi:C-terminal processing protease CtpA/Prc